MARYNAVADSGVIAGLRAINEWRIERKKTIPYNDPVTREQKVLHIQSLLVAYRLPKVAGNEGEVSEERDDLLTPKAIVAAARVSAFNLGISQLLERNSTVGGGSSGSGGSGLIC